MKMEDYQIIFSKKEDNQIILSLKSKKKRISLNKKLINQVK